MEGFSWETFLNSKQKEEECQKEYAIRREKSTNMVFHRSQVDIHYSELIKNFEKTREAKEKRQKFQLAIAFCLLCFLSFAFFCLFVFVRLGNEKKNKAKLVSLKIGGRQIAGHSNHNPSVAPVCPPNALFQEGTKSDFEEEHVSSVQETSISTSTSTSTALFLKDWSLDDCELCKQEKEELAGRKSQFKKKKPKSAKDSGDETEDQELVEFDAATHQNFLSRWFSFPFLQKHSKKTIKLEKDKETSAAKPPRNECEEKAMATATTNFLEESSSSKQALSLQSISLAEMQDLPVCEEEEVATPSASAFSDSPSCDTFGKTENNEILESNTDHEQNKQSQNLPHFENRDTFFQKQITTTKDFDSSTTTSLKVLLKQPCYLRLRLLSSFDFLGLLKLNLPDPSKVSLDASLAHSLLSDYKLLLDCLEKTHDLVSISKLKNKKLGRTVFISYIQTCNVFRRVSLIRWATNELKKL